MQQAVPIFQDRAEAGVKLTEAVSEAGLKDLADPVLIALPRGGVPVASKWRIGWACRWMC